jgi:hypothetical protein
MATPPIEVADQLSCTHPSVKRGKRPVWRVPNQCLIEESTEPRDQGRSAGPKVDSNQRLAVEVQFGKPSHVLPDDNERLVPREPCGRHEPTVVEQECASATYEYRSEHQRTCPEAQHCSPRHHRPITSGDHRTACRSKNRHGSREQTQAHTALPQSHRRPDGRSGAAASESHIASIYEEDAGASTTSHTDTPILLLGSEGSTKGATLRCASGYLMGFPRHYPEGAGY